MTTKLHITQDQVYETEGELYFWFRLSDTHVLRDIPVDFSKACRPILEDIATHADIIGYRKLKKLELVNQLKQNVKIEIPDNLSNFMIATTERDILMEYYDFEQVYIPKTQQSPVETVALKDLKFWFAEDKKVKYSLFINTLTLKELRAICKVIKLNGYSTRKRQDLITLLEDKLVFEEQGS
jgi:hypothetical protein